MPARDRLHEHVRNALVQDGWTITHDPLHLRWGAKDMYVDLGAERFLGAEKGAARSRSRSRASPVEGDEGEQGTSED
jgi:hypothetical protein